MATYSKTLKLSTYTSVTYEYTVTETETATTYKLTKATINNSRDAGFAQKYYWYLWCTLESPSQGTEVKEFCEKTVTVAKGTKSKSVTIGTSASIAKGTSSTPAWMFLRADLDTTDYERHWEKEAYYSHPSPALKSYSVAYNANGGSGAPAAQTKWYGRALALSATRPTRTNHQFLGWATSSVATAAAYQPGGSYTANAATTLYAVWRQVYASPGLTITRSYRCDSAGNADDEGAYAAVQVEWSCFSGTNPVRALSATVNGVTASIASPSSLARTGQHTFVINAQMNPNLSYAVTATITDQGCQTSGVTGSSATTTRTDSISTAYYPMDFRKGGHGFGIGTAANEEGVCRIQHSLKVLDDSGNTVLLVKKDGSVTVANPAAWRAALGIS